jgi:protease I
MSKELQGLRVAILVTDGFEQVEMTKPREALQKAGAETHLIAPRSGQVQGWNHDEKGDKFPVDKTLDSVEATDYDAYMQPGGVASPDRLRMIPRAVQFVKDFSDQNKPIAAICHGPWMLVEAGLVEGKTLTSWPSLKSDIRNAGGRWVDRDVVTDGNIVTSRKPDDIPAFNREMIVLFSRAVSEPEHAGASRKQR